VRNNVTRLKVEFHILDSLIGSRDFNKELRNVLLKYPEVIPCIPILIAIRNRELKVIDDFFSAETYIAEYSFRKRKLSNEEVEELVEFFEKTGLRYFFEELSSKSIQDYVTGVEVGLDTNARKNRSGNAMELLLKPVIESIKARQDIPHLLFQKKFAVLNKEFGIKVSSELLNRQADFILLDKKNRVINIEANFFSRRGSKPQEIVDSYINRQNELKENGFEFIWISDGLGWKTQKNQMIKAFEKVDYLLNLHFVREGLLEGILCEI